MRIINYNHLKPGDYVIYNESRIPHLTKGKRYRIDSISKHNYQDPLGHLRTIYVIGDDSALHGGFFCQRFLLEVKKPKNLPEWF